MKNPAETRCDNTPVRAEFQVPNCELPKSANVVIVGGGIAGTSLAYHFAKAGWTEVVLIEQNKLSSGTTWHAAGMVGQLRSSSAQTQVNKASVELYERLEQETGHDPGWLQCGGLQLATCEGRMHQLQRQTAMAEVFGVEAEMISAERCSEFWPMLNADGILGGTYLAGDGRVLPGECTIAMAKAALQGGVKIVEDTRVEELHFDIAKNGLKRFTGLSTNRGPIQTEWIILASNMWMRQIGLSVGVDIPVYPCEHHYLITRPIEGVTRNAPCTRDPDSGNYFRSLDDGSMKLGAFQRHSKHWEIGDQVPSDFAFSLLEPDWPDFEEPFAAFQHRLKGISRDDVVKFVNGPEAFTPDNNFIMGQPLLTEGLFVQGGWNSAGIACAGGAGKYAVEWLEQGGMTIDLSAADIKRFHPFQNDRSYLQKRVSEVLGLHYRVAWPGREKETSRDIRASSFYEEHKKANAFFGETSGWERPRFYAPTDVIPSIEYSFQRQNWHSWVAEEVRHCREQIGLLDQSTFGKFTVQGPDAHDLLQKLCGANIDCAIDHAVYTGMFNERGTFEADLVVARLQQDKFYVVTSTAQQQHDYDWIFRHIEPGANLSLTDVTEEYNVLSVMGPEANALLIQIDASVFQDPNQAYGTVSQFSFNGISIIAIRMSYVGEQGWELHVQTADTPRLYEAISEFDSKVDLRWIGTQAMSTMRVEKGMRAYGHELSPLEDPLEAGLGFAIDWETDFIGKPTLLKRRSNTPHKRLVCFQVSDPRANLWGNEPILRNGETVGYTSSVCFSPTLESSLAMGYVKLDNEPLTNGVLQTSCFNINCLGQDYAAKASFRPFLR